MVQIKIINNYITFNIRTIKMGLIDLIWETAKTRKVDVEEVIDEEVHGHSLRTEILREVLEKYGR